jgi:prepilin-type processing-associated H-X9-DG protein
MSMTPPVEAPTPPPKRNNSAIIILVVLGGVGLMCIVLIAAGAAILFPVFAQARQSARRTLAMSRMRSVAMATLMYANDTDDRLPIADSWMDALSKYDAHNGDFLSPGLDRRNPMGPPDYGIAFMKSLSAAKLAAIANPGEHVLIFDSTLMNRNATSGLETVPKPPRFGSAESGGNVFAFVDGHVKLTTAAAAVNLK